MRVFGLPATTGIAITAVAVVATPDEDLLGKAS
jgi:hypothetical protein